MREVNGPETSIYLGENGVTCFAIHAGIREMHCKSQLKYAKSDVKHLDNAVTLIYWFVCYGDFSLSLSGLTFRIGSQLCYGWRAFIRTVTPPIADSLVIGGELSFSDGVSRPEIVARAPRMPFCGFCFVLGL